MLFNSFEFIIFLFIAFVLHWVVLKKNRSRAWMLLIASCAFYMFFVPAYILILFVTIIIDYAAGIYIARSQGRRRKRYLIISIISTCLVLFVFKYCNFFIGNFNSLAKFTGLHYNIEILEIILPIGLSFHTFQSLSYVIEVYRKQQEPEKDFVIYSLYVMYFPQLVAGPIERAAHLLHQFHKEKHFDSALATEGIRQMIWGFFKKIVVADTCAGYANFVFENYEQLPSPTIIMGAIAFSFQIYGDFSGYSDIALGTSKLFGIQLMTNFRFPYLATNIIEFWRRWHISLSTWFRDYVYFPMGGSKSTGWKFYRNVFTIFLLSGFWHGANWTFIIWGLIHAVIYCLYVLIFGRKTHPEKSGILSSLTSVFGALITFLVVSVAWVFFRAADTETAFDLLSAIFINGIVGSSNFDFAHLFILLIPFQFFEYINRNNTNGVPLSQYSLNRFWRISMDTFFVLLIVDCYYSLNHEQFIYFQF